MKNPVLIDFKEDVFEEDNVTKVKITIGEFTETFEQGKGPFTVEKKIATSLLKNYNYFEKINPIELTEEDLKSLKVDELKTVADREKVKIESSDKKSDIIQKLVNKVSSDQEDDQNDSQEDDQDSGQENN